jgi:translation initiation factor eIF-2B subunit delta
MTEWIDSYIADRIVYAQDEMVRQGIELLSKTKKDHIMVIGLNVVLEKLFMKAHADGKEFSVIVVDTSPRFLGRDLVKRLSASGVDCKYTLMHGVSALIHKATKLFIGASYVLGNGGVVS